MSSKNNLFKSAFLAVFGLFLSLVLTLISPASTFAKTKTYGYADKAKNYLYNQAANWWGDGDGSKKNGSGINAFAAAVSVLNDTRISPATIAELSFKGNIWNLSGAAPSDLIIRLAGDQSIGAEVIKSAAGSSVSVRLKAVAKTIQSGGVVVARATGSSPFNTGESGGHYIAIFGYKSDNKLYVYDPGKAKGSWVSGKSFIKKMKKDIMFYALGRGFGANVADIDFFSSASLADPDPETPVSDDEPSSEDDDPAPEIDDCASNPSNPNCISDPSDDPSSDDGDTGIEPEGDQYFDDFSAEQLTGTSRAVFDDALSSAWPTIVETGSETASGTCYDSYGNPYTNYAADSGKCKASIKSELRTLLEVAGLSSNLATAQSSSSFIGALLIKNNAISSLNKTNLTQSYLYELLNAGTNGWGRVESPVSGDIVYYNSKFFYWIGDSGRNWGNAITAGDGWVPHIENVTLSGTYRVYRYGGGGTGGGDGGGEAPGIDDQVPPDEQPEGEAAVPEEASGEKIAARALSFSWPYTKYSTDDESAWGKCVKKYSGSAGTTEKRSNFPSMTATSLASKNLSKYPTGTSCNKTITPAYAKYKGITSTSKMNSYSVGSISFVRNVFSSLGINIGYLSISDLRNKLDSLDNWELIAKNINSTEGLQPGDLLVAKNAAMIYVGELGSGYGEVAQSYKGKWGPRLTPIFYNDTYVFRLKTGSNISESGDCPEEKTVDSVEGNEKIAVAAANAAWPYTGGSANKIGRCLKGSSLTGYPAIYTYSVANDKLTTKSKSASKLAKERKNTGCLSTAKSSNIKGDIKLLYSALESAGVKRVVENSDVDAVWFFDAVINTYPDDWEVVTQKLTSKNKSSTLKLGDIIVARTMKNKKVTATKAYIYIGKYGKDCLGVDYGDVVTSSATETPYVLPLTFESKTEYWVLRTKSGAWNEPEVQTESVQPEPTETAETSEPEETASTGAQRIAETAMKFSWPFTKYSTSISDFWGKCIYWFPGKSPSNALVSYPQPYKNNKFSDKSNSASPGTTGTYYACANTLTPARASNSTVGVSGVKGKSFSDIVETDKNDAGYGGYNVGFNASISNLKSKVVFDTLKAAKGYDCIKFVTDVLRAAGTSTKTNVYGSSDLAKQSGWKKIGSSIENNVSDLKKSSKLVTDQGIEMEPGDVVVREASQGKHTFIWLGQMGWPYGDRAEGGKDEYVGGLIMDTFIADHVYNYGKYLNVYRYYGE